MTIKITNIERIKQHTHTSPHELKKYFGMPMEYDERNGISNPFGIEYIWISINIFTVVHFKMVFFLFFYVVKPRPFNWLVIHNVQRHCIKVALSNHRNKRGDMQRDRERERVRE